MAGERPLSPSEAQDHYDRYGAKQDSQAYYEDPAFDRLIQYSDFENAHHVFEFGCGTGRLALRLFETILPPDTHYRAVDLSNEMVLVARRRLQPFSERVGIRQSDGSVLISLESQTIDRFLTTYVLDILSEQESKELINEAQRVLVPGGLMCLASLTVKSHGFSNWLSRLWMLIFRLFPKRVGGCRPIDLRSLISEMDWEIQHHSTVRSFGITSEVFIARRV